MNSFVTQLGPPRLQASSTHPRRTISSERGVALLAAVLLALVLSALGTALSVSGQTETAVVRNHQRAAEARAAAEAGFSHAAELTIRRLNAWQANGFANPRLAITAVLRGPDNAIHATLADPSNADNGSLEALEIAGEIELPQFPALVLIPAMQGASYQARILDDDDPSRNLTAADRTRIGENGQPYADNNKHAVLRVTGFALDNTVVTLEGMVARTAYPAIVSDQSILVVGSPFISGTDGSVHSNVDLTVSGSPTLTQDATATGAYTVTGNPSIGGNSGGGRPPIPIPDIQASNYRANADFVLTTGVGGGRIHGPFNADGSLGPVICNASLVNAACLLTFGWEYNPANTGWNVSSNILPNGTYYVMGHATVSGNPGHVGAPKSVTIIAEGNIEISGTPRFTPDTAELMFVTNGDLKISGNMQMVAGAEGSILVREQMLISGNPVLYSNILIDNATSLSNMVLDTAIVGNPSITYNGTLGGQGFTVTGWREIR
jgi:hypothetical protein